ncbi:MAG: Asp-tRNA(Asn)/Glu-tRNA(Gln) amidotransferase subunit GatC [Chloroflexota bacterium]
MAYLARLQLSEGDKAQLQQQLAAILDHIAVLQELETDHIAPTSRVAPLENIVREDIVRSSLPVEAVLANAPEQQDGYFRVRAVLEDH